MAPHSPTMSHIPHYGTPGYSSNPTSKTSQSPVAYRAENQTPKAAGHQSPLIQNAGHQSPFLNREKDSPLSLSLRKNLPAPNPIPPDSPLLKSATPQDSPSLKSVNGHPGSKIKCVFIGDGAVGKTSLIISYTTNGYPSEYIPTAIDTYHATVHVDGQPLTLELCDTPGQDDFDTLRPLVYPHTDVFLLCFSVVMPSTFQNVKEKWIPEIRSQSKKVPIVLVGTQSDLREDAKTLVGLRNFKEQPIQEAEARKVASSLGCETYVESSALTQKNLKEVFDNAIMEGLKSRRLREDKGQKKNRKKKKCSIL